MVALHDLGKPYGEATNVLLAHGHINRLCSTAAAMKLAYRG
jgi:hypothetical protein